MITQRFVTIYGIVGIAVMCILLGLVWFKLVPSSFYLPAFLLAMAVFAGRLVLRLLYARQERNRQSSGNPSKLDSSTP